MRRTTLVLALVVGLVSAACGSGGVYTGGKPSATGGDPKLAGAATTAFGVHLFGTIRGHDNTVVSPVSVAIALAMVEPGATDDAKKQLDQVLQIADPAAFHASMAALRTSLESASPGKQPGRKPGQLTIAIANAAFVQRGYAIKPAYTDALSRSYGPLLKSVDFAGKSSAAVHDINKFIDAGTHGHITKVLDHLPLQTVLALVNALYLKASWYTPFETSATRHDRFTRLDGSKVDMKLMHGKSDNSLAGDGWVAARKNYTARLAADFVLPDSGRFDEVAAELGSVFDGFDQHTARGGELAVPKLATRFQHDLTPPLKTLGLEALYQDGHLLGIADDPTLKLDTAIHATYLAIDETGTEASAATVLGFTAVGAPLGDRQPVPVILDRPFFFRIVDTETGATLFIGQITDPTT